MGNAIVVATIIGLVAGWFGYKVLKKRTLLRRIYIISTFACIIASLICVNATEVHGFGRFLMGLLYVPTIFLGFSFIIYLYHWNEDYEKYKRRSALDVIPINDRIKKAEKELEYHIGELQFWAIVKADLENEKKTKKQ